MSRTSPASSTCTKSTSQIIILICANPCSLLLRDAFFWRDEKLLKKFFADGLRVNTGLPDAIRCIPVHDPLGFALLLRISEPSTVPNGRSASLLADIQSRFFRILHLPRSKRKLTPSHCRNMTFHHFLPICKWTFHPHLPYRSTFVLFTGGDTKSLSAAGTSHWGIRMASTSCVTRSCASQPLWMGWCAWL